MAPRTSCLVIGEPQRDKHSQSISSLYFIPHAELQEEAGETREKQKQRQLEDLKPHKKATGTELNQKPSCCETTALTPAQLCQYFDPKKKKLVKLELCLTIGIHPKSNIVKYWIPEPESAILASLCSQTGNWTRVYRCFSHFGK